MAQNQCTSENPCTAVQLLVQRTENHEKLLEEMKNRLPPWVTAAGTVGGVIIGTLGGILSVFAK